MNTEKNNTFENGKSTDLYNTVKAQNGYSKGINGRLYSHEGTIAFSAIKGTKPVYQNDNIIKYLGSYSFSDELIAFVKHKVPVGLEWQTVEECHDVIVANSFIARTNPNDTSPIAISQEFSDFSNETENCYQYTKRIKDETDFSINFTEETDEPDSFDPGDYYFENTGQSNYQSCPLGEVELPIHNQQYYDAIYSLRKNPDGNLTGTLLWIGTQNWPMDAKITTEGNEENEFYKRVYYTNAFNTRKVVNIKDPNLSNRGFEEFEQILDNTLLQPEVVSVQSGGQLKAMRANYYYRIVSENGQVSQFSPASEMVDVLSENQAIEYRGGNISEITDKTVKIKINLMVPEPSSEVEMVALEYEAQGPPTAIRNLGRKPAKNLVQFQHYGNEPEFSDNITIQDILEQKNTFKYVNDYTSKKNKLIAAGLRNEPIPSVINDLEYLLPLHSWELFGETHKSIMNPKPWHYRYIDPNNTDKLIYIRSKIYRSISTFGPLTLKFVHKQSGFFVQKTFVDISTENYTDITAQVTDWLLDQYNDNPFFRPNFPNLQIVRYTGQLYFKASDPLQEMDMSNYVFESNNPQFVENYDSDVVFRTVNINVNNFVYGAQSIGFSEGTGVRVTYEEVKEPLLNQAQSVYDGSGNILDYETPSHEKYAMKGEIYRLAFQAYKSDSTRYFSVPLGDIMIPEIGDMKKEIDQSGNIILTPTQYRNQSVENGILYGHGIRLRIEVRLSCELQQLIPMYQILYVERTEENRTILTQGIAFPLTRVQENGSESHQLPLSLRDKWSLNYYGGPTYEKIGLEHYDNDGENFQYDGDYGDDKRVMQHRRLMSFDSPDLYYRRVSPQYLESSKLQVVAKLNTDHTPGVIMERGGNLGTLLGLTFNTGDEAYPKFSRKILEEQLEGVEGIDNYPIFSNQTSYNYFINVSVYAQYFNYKKSFSIKAARSLDRGEIISGSAFDTDNDISNNAFVLPTMPWYYGLYQRNYQYQDGRPNSSVFGSGRTSVGYPTVIIKTDEDLFTKAFIGSDIHRVNTHIRLGGPERVVYDTVPLINIFRNNRESVYGGRTSESYTQNTYIALSKTIPVVKNSNAGQVFYSGIDTYMTLAIRTKNDFSDEETFDGEYNNDGGARAKNDIKTLTRSGAWAYAVVLESQIEPKQSFDYEFYRRSQSVNFGISRDEIINPAYFNVNNLNEHIPKPFKFRDDPDRGHVVAVSDVKIPGDYYDSWTVFKPNNYYALLEKNKGNVSNVFRYDENVFAVQQHQTSMLYIGVDRIVNDADGTPINIKQGSGTVVEGHKILSQYGTRIRRAVTISDFGFVFFDENNNEFIKGKDPLFVTNDVHLEYDSILQKNPVMDTESYFDHEMKESNICLKLKDGSSYIVSYNERFQKINGDYQFSNDMYMMFDKNVFAPINKDGNSMDLHQLNKGKLLDLFNDQKKLILGIHVTVETEKVFQYKQWNCITNIKYPIEKVFFRSNLGYDRDILGTHEWYKIREGNHSVPAINNTIVYEEVRDVRGNWVYVEMTVPVINGQERINILAVTSAIRYSHQ